MGAGMAFALVAGMMWGRVFVGPLLLPDYPATLQSFGRYLAGAILGQLIVFESLAALSDAYLLRGHWPEPLTLTGACLLVAGVLWAVRIRPVERTVFDERKE